MRKIIVHVATSADGFIARPDGDIDWLTRRPPPKGFYGLGAFEKTIDTKLLGRKTYAVSLALGATFGSKTRHYVFSRQPAPSKVPAGVEFVTEPIGLFAERLRKAPGKDIWLMGGGSLIASFLDAQAIDELVISVVPVFIGEGIPLMEPRHRDVPLRLVSARDFPDGVVQVHYEVQRQDRARRFR